jgi:hypothetical protein
VFFISLLLRLASVWWQDHRRGVEKAGKQARVEPTASVGVWELGVKMSRLPLPLVLSRRSLLWSVGWWVGGDCC